MELFRIHKTIPFMKYSKILNAISFISFFIAIGLLVVRGLAFSIEFTGGLVMEVNYPDAVPVQELRVDLEKATGGEVQVVNFGTARDAQIRLPLKGNKTSAQMSEEVMKVIHEKAPEAQLRRTEFVGPQVGEELATDGLTALLLVVVGIMVYLAFRFEWKFAVAAIIANMHDVFLVLGVFSLFQWEFSLPVLAAVLAVLGYSVNESVIIFDRCRECFRKIRKGTAGGNRQYCDYADHFPYGDYAQLDLDGHTVDVLLRRSGPALLCTGSDHRYFAGRLFFRVRVRCDCSVFGRQTRRFGEEGPQR